MKLKIQIFEAKLSLNQTTKKLLVIKKIDILIVKLVGCLLMKGFCLKRMIKQSHLVKD